MIDKIIDLFDKGYCNECNELNCLGEEPSSKTVANAIRELQEENQKLKQWDKNKDTRNSRQRIEISRLLKENKKLKSLLEKQSKINVADHKYASLKEDEVIELADQLKQRDEVIDKLIVNWNFLEKYLDENKMVLNNPEIFQFYLIQKEILQKYKGDNK